MDVLDASDGKFMLNIKPSDRSGTFKFSRGSFLLGMKMVEHVKAGAAKAGSSSADEPREHLPQHREHLAPREPALPHALAPTAAIAALPSALAAAVHVHGNPLRRGRHLAYGQGRGHAWLGWVCRLPRT